MTEKMQSVLEKVKKLIALAGNNPNQEEAESAMMRAQQLLAKHGLSMAQAEASAGVKQEATEKQGTVHSKAATWWQKLIADVIARNFRCRIYLNMFRGGHTYLIFVGLPVDVEVASDIYDLAVGTAKREADKYLRLAKDKALVWNRSISVATRNDYIRGWVGGLRESFRENVESNALVVVVPEEVNDHMQQKKLRQVPNSRTTTAGSEEARRSGRTDGSRFNRREKIAPGPAPSEVSGKRKFKLKNVKRG